MIRQALLERLENAAEANGFRVKITPFVQWAGCCSYVYKTIKINSKLPQHAMLQVLIHEIAHVMCGHLSAYFTELERESEVAKVCDEVHKKCGIACAPSQIYVPFIRSHPVVKQFGSLDKARQEIKDGPVRQDVVDKVTSDICEVLMAPLVQPSGATSLGDV